MHLLSQFFKQIMWLYYDNKNKAVHNKKNVLF